MAKLRLRIPRRSLSQKSNSYAARRAGFAIYWRKAVSAAGIPLKAISNSRGKPIRHRSEATLVSQRGGAGKGGKGRQPLGSPCPPPSTRLAHSGPGARPALRHET